MRRWMAIWHVLVLAVAAALYFFFVLPRWYELMGDFSHGFGTAMRIVTGALIGLGALPVVFTLLRTRRPEFGTPQLALTLRTSSIVLHVLAGVLIVGTAIGEIWLSLNSFGQWFFAIYGAAAAVALLGALTFYLAYVAELPPPPPKPIKLKEKTRRQGRKSRRKAGAEEAVEEATEEATEVGDQAADDAEPETAEVPAEETDRAGDETTTEEDAVTNGKPRNRRPSGKSPSSRLRRRTRGGVAVED